MLGLERLAQKVHHGNHEGIIDRNLLDACRKMAKNADKRKDAHPSSLNGLVSEAIEALLGSNHEEAVEGHISGYAAAAKQLDSTYHNMIADAVPDPELLPQVAGSIAASYQMHRAWLQGYQKTGSTILAHMAITERMEQVMWMLGSESLSQIGL